LGEKFEKLIFREKRNFYKVYNVLVIMNKRKGVKMKRKGQAAMEFLMTYGWAILAAIIVIGVLALYFRPGDLVGQTATISPPFTAVSWAITASNDVVDIEVKNNGAETVNIAAATDVAMTINSPAGTCSPVLSVTQGAGTVTFPDYAWNPGVTLFIRCTHSVGLTEGQSFDGNIEITYTSGSGTLSKIGTGTVSGKINA
jgi:uncharacterized protein (UPF0333 family)